MPPVSMPASFAKGAKSGCVSLLRTLPGMRLKTRREGCSGSCMHGLVTALSVVGASVPRGGRGRGFGGEKRGEGVL